MLGRWRAGCLLVAAVSAGILMTLSQTPARPPMSDQPLRLGFATSLFRSMPESVIEVGLRLLRELMETQTGLRGQIQGRGDASSLGKMLHEGNVDLALFHGFEFAWVKNKYPDLMPLVLVSNPRPLQACLVVAREGRIVAPGDLQGKYVAVPAGSRGHCLLFLERRCCPVGQKPDKFFKKVTAPSDALHALENVCDDRIGAAVVERGAYEEYCRAWPGRAAQLKVLLQSEIFPPGVIAYHARKLPTEIVRRLREGMLNAHLTKEGKDLLDLCRMIGFESAPADYLKSLYDIARAYPDPDTR